MMVRLLPLLLLAACEQMPATGSPFEAVPAPRPAAAPASSPSSAAPLGEDDFDFDGDAGEDEDPGAGEDLDPAQLLALMQGQEMPEPTPEPVPAPAPAPVAAPVPVAAHVPTPMPVWDPAMAVSPDWGVRLVSTLIDTQPPRAVLGLSDGTEVVVQPGTFLADHRLVVLAVGRDAVQISRVVPEGYQARVETRTIQSLFPGPRRSSN